jgi:SAM-dependent methyltransferase
MWRQGGCPVCRENDAADIAEICGVPASAGQLCATAEEAARSAGQNVLVAVCRACGYVGNRSFDPALVPFGPAYDASLDGSPGYRRFLDELAAALIDRYRLSGQTVVEVGCGKGYFLRRLARLGIARGVGIDPSTAFEGVERVGEVELRFVRDHYGHAYAGLGAELICCRHALHEVVRPRELLVTARHALDEGRGRAVYFEVPNGADILAESKPWRLMYEYASYFTAECLEALFTVCGFRTLRVAPCYAGGQYLAVEAAPALSRAARVPWHPVSEQSLRTLLECGRGFGRAVEVWERRLEDLGRRRGRIAVWGAGGRGLNFLALVAAARVVGCVVDISPSRQGRFVPRTAQRVMPPETLIDYQPSTVIVTNPTYRTEIEPQLADMGLSCEVLTI